jgi:hypothetical protein
MTARQRLPIDVFMFGAFMAAYKPLATGFSLHEWQASSWWLPPSCIW